MAQKWYQKASVQVAMVSTIGIGIITAVTILHQRSELQSDNETLSRDLKEIKAVLRSAKTDNKTLSRDLKMTEEVLRKAEADNKTVSRDLKKTEEDLRKAEAERRTADTRLAPFLAAADEHFRDVPKVERLSALSKKLDGMMASVQRGDQSILLKLDTIGDAVEALNKRQSPPGDRSIPPTVAKTMTLSLKKFTDWQVEITCLMGDGEAHSLSEQLKVVFANAGWKVSGVNQALFNKPARRIDLTFGSQPPAELQRSLFPLFDSFGYPREAGLNPPQGDKTLKIVVGTR